MSGDEIELEAGRAPRDPEELDAAAGGSPPELPGSTALGPVELTVADLRRSLDYYGRAIGLDILERDDGRVSLGAGGESWAAVSAASSGNRRGQVVPIAIPVGSRRQREAVAIGAGLDRLSRVDGFRSPAPGPRRGGTRRACS